MLVRLAGSLMLALSLGVISTSAIAQPYPSKPIRIVVPFGPGSATDTITRLVGERASKLLGVPIVVDNKPGANGLIAAREVATSPKDGYTLIVSSNSAHAANLYLYKDLGYDPVKDFTPITGLTTNPHVIVVRSTLPVQNMKEFIQYGKDNPGKLNFGAGNTGALANASLLKSLAGFTATEVQYKSQPAAVTDLLGGRIDFISIDYFIVADHIKVGTLRPLAVTSTTRLKALPNVPPLAEILPGYELNGWVAAFAPAGTPPDIVAKLNKTFIDVMSAPAWEEYMERQGMLSFPTTPAQLGMFQQEQVAKWADVLRKAGVERQ